MSLTERVRQRALELGFDLCRFTSADPPASGEALRRWLAAGHHGAMAWMARNADKRIDPARVLPACRSVISVAVSYHETIGKSKAAASPPHAADVSGSAPARGRIARYARYADYHDVMGRALAGLTAFLTNEAAPESSALWYVDTGPVLERDLAQRAGLGFVGKHTNLISRHLGNWFFLGEILTTASLEPDSSARNLCGKCVRCLSACPTQAITAPFQLDARRCISYLTIELKEAIPVEWRPAIGDRIYGCDDCLEACPWNRFATEARLMRPHARAKLAAPELEGLLNLNEPGFKKMFDGTPVLRTRRRGLLRNVCVALGNVGTARNLPALEQAARDPEPLIAEHARWALERIRARESVQRHSPC